MAVHAAQRMDSVGNTLWVVPVDQGTEASISALGELSQTRATWWSVETAQRTAVSFKDSFHEGAQRQSGNAPQSAPGPRLKTSGWRPFQDPDSRVVVARDRVSRLERALEARGDREGPEVDGLRAAFEKAREFTEGVPLDKQIKDGEQFLIRAKGHLVELEKECRQGQHRRRRAETRTVEGPGRSSPTSGTNAATTKCSSNDSYGGRDQAFARTGGGVGRDQHDAGASSRAPTSFRSGGGGFGSDRLWPVEFWPIHFWPAHLAGQFWPVRFWPVHFWPIRFWPIHFDVVVCVVVCVVCCVLCVVCCVFCVFSKPSGLHKTTREPKRAHLTHPALQTPPKFHEKTPEKDKKSEHGAGEGKKSAKFWASHPSGPPTLRGPHPSRPHPSRPHPSRPHPSGPDGAPLFPGLGLHPSGAF